MPFLLKVNSKSYIITIYTERGRHMRDKYGFACFVANSLVLAVMITACIVPIFILADSIWLKVILIAASVLICGFAEERLLSGTVNGLVEKIRGRKSK